MPISPIVSSAVLQASKQAAIAFYEDIDHIKDIFNKLNITKAEIRRLSSSIRRILVSYGGDLSSISPPRVGKITILAPDNSWFYGNEKRCMIKYFGSGCGDKTGFKLFGGHTRGVIVQYVPLSGIIYQPPIPPKCPDIDKLIEATPDTFLNQKVIFFSDVWATRRDVIKFVANVAGGAHTSNKLETKQDIMLSKVRNCVNYRNINNMLDTHINLDLMHNPNGDFIFNNNEIDVVSYELLCAAHYLSCSPSIIDLCSIIKREFYS